MLRSMSAKQFREWQVYAQLEPFDNDREDELVGAVIQILANVNRSKERKYRPFTLDEATPSFGDRPSKAATKRQKTDEEMRDHLRNALTPRGKG